MSARNGDKARFGKQKKRRMTQRLKVRALREELKSVVPADGTVVEAPRAEQEVQPQGEHHSALGSAAQSIGSVLGSFAAKVKGVSHSEPAAAH